MSKGDEINRLAEQFRDSLTFLRKSATDEDRELVLHVTSMLAVGLGFAVCIAHDLNRIADAMEASADRTPAGDVKPEQE